MSGDLPERKHPRLKNYDYSQNWAYFITICAFQKQKIFSSISGDHKGEAFGTLSIFGQIAKKQVEEIQFRFPGIVVDKYVIMPNHIHLLLTVEKPEKSICDVICAFKSITARNCRRIAPELRVFQASFHDHIIRNESDYLRIWNYIDTNVQRWENDCFYI